jgi:single-stranded-DNA-specific exonuclease
LAFGIKPLSSQENPSTEDLPPQCGGNPIPHESDLLTLWGNPGTPMANLIGDLYARRGGDFRSEQDTLLEPQKAIRRLARPIGSDGMLGANTAADLLHDALVNHVPIAIVGDFDVDGVCATAILMRALRPFTVATAIIPDRKSEGYGLSPLLAERIPKDAGLVITVDNGISALAGAQVLRGRGQKLLITDHHLPGDVIPQADAILNPNQPGCPFPWKSTCGAGVAWYLLWALQTVHAEWKGTMPIRDLLSLVAVATVADVVPLEYNNRLLVRIGLDIVRQGRGPLGLQALFRVAGKDPSHATSMDCGFVVGPRLNAVGRMANMMTGLDLLLTEDEAVAQGLARELDATNRERRQVEGAAMDEAVEQAVQSVSLAVKNTEINGTDTPDILVLANASWHEGVVGLMAGRLRERFGVPVFVFAQSQHGGWKGSGRSMPGFHLRDMLAWVDAKYPGLIGHFGGHAMAAGLSLASDPMDDFRAAVQRYPGWLSLRGSLAGGQPVETDGALPMSLMNLHTAIAIRASGPWGSGFPEPVFEGYFRVLESTTMKGGHWRLRLAHCVDAAPYDVDSQARPVTAVRFLRDARDTDKYPPAENSVVFIRYTLQVNRWRDEDTLQVLIQNGRTIFA